MSKSAVILMPASECQYPKEDLKGKRFGTYEVIEFAGRDPNKKNAYWLCRCDCGSEPNVKGSNLKHGGRGSGCKKCAAQKAKVFHTEHGHSVAQGGRKASKAYSRWHSMIQRCHCPTHRAYKDYGARGITVCDRWRNSFPNFLDDMGECPDGMTLDRKENDKGYSKENCRWASRIEQANNTRRTTFIEVGGERMTLRAVSVKFGVRLHCLKQRIKRGWTPERAINGKMLTESNYHSSIPSQAIQPLLL